MRVIRQEWETGQGRTHSSLQALSTSLQVLRFQLDFVQSLDCIIPLCSQSSEFYMCLFLYALYGGELKKE